MKEELREELADYFADYEITPADLLRADTVLEIIKAHGYGQLAAEREKREAVEKELERAREALKEIENSCQPFREGWDTWRKAISEGEKGSWPRDAFESHLDNIEITAKEALKGGENDG